MTSKNNSRRIYRASAAFLALLFLLPLTACGRFIAAVTASTTPDVTPGETAPVPTSQPTPTQSLPAQPSPVPSDAIGLFTVMAEEFLSLRSAPDTGAETIQKLEPGTLVTVWEYQGDFARVSVEGTEETGYVLRRYLVEGAQPPEEIQSVVAGNLYKAQVNEFLSLRVAPNTGSERTVKLTPGTLVRVLDAENGFTRVHVPVSGAYGYVMADYLILAGEDADPGTESPQTLGMHAVVCREFVTLRSSANTAADAIATLTPGTRVDVSGHDGIFARVKVAKSGEMGFILTEYLTRVTAEETSVPEELFTVVCEDYISLRSAPDTRSDRLAKLQPGAQVRILGQEGDFSRVALADKSLIGYVLTRFLSGKSEPSIGTGNEREYQVRCNEFLTVRAEPSTSAEALGRLLRGKRVRIEEFSGIFARITQSGGSLAGYVMAGYLTPVMEDQTLAGLRIVKPVVEYSYEAMMEDIRALAEAFPGLVRVESAGWSLEGRDIPTLLLGNPGARRHVLIHGSVHGREHMTSLLILAQIEYCLRFGDAKYADATLAEWLSGVCFHIIPMVNPDGVTISQRAEMTDSLGAIYEFDQARGYCDLSARDYLSIWKANASGVDINRNFPAGWESLSGPSVPSLSHYRGEKAGDQPETKALMDYTLAHDFDATLSYHASGSCIYWQYGQDGAVNARSRDLARALRACTGYLLSGAAGLDAGGYKDWAMETLGIPSVTIEIGGRGCPLPFDEFATIWERNRDVLAAAARWVRAGE
jgi:g-D-glutamyl-meso-diaminopimelate peptidase